MSPSAALGRLVQRDWLGIGEGLGRDWGGIGVTLMGYPSWFQCRGSSLPYRAGHESRLTEHERNWPLASPQTARRRYSTRKQWTSCRRAMGGVQASPKHSPGPPLHFLFGEHPIRFLGAKSRDLSTDNHNATFRSSRWLKRVQYQDRQKRRKSESGDGCPSLLFTKHPKARYSDKG